MAVARRTFAAAFVAVVVLSSCSSSDSSSDKASPTTTAAPVTAAGPNSDSELEARLVTNVPSGFVEQPDDVGDTGPSDLAKAVRDDGTPGVRADLQEEGFVRGYQRLWIGPDDAQIIVFLYQFETPAGAQADYERTLPNLTGGLIPGIEPFTLEGFPAERSQGAEGSSEDVSTAVVLFTTGVYDVQIICNGPAVAGLRACATDVAKDQNDRLS